MPIRAPARSAPLPITDGRRTSVQHFLIYVFVAVPMIALVATVPLVWGWGVNWHDLALLAVFHTV
ncbi:MAG: acyl-CoA desaturase, partial [Pseudonocardia sp.]